MNLRIAANILALVLCVCLVASLTGCSVNVIYAPQASVEVLKDANKTMPTLMTLEDEQ